MVAEANFVEGESDNLNGSALAAAPTRPLREDLARKAKDLARTALELEQTALFDEPEFEEALLLSQEDVEKRYTAENAKQIEWRRSACIKLLARQVPTRDIADILHMNHRLVGAIASQEMMKIAGFSEAFSESLLASAASDLALAETKKHDAPYNQLMFGMGVKMTHAVAIRMIGAGAMPEQGKAIELESENPALVRAREFLEGRKRLAGTLAPPEDRA